MKGNEYDSDRLDVSFFQDLRRMAANRDLLKLLILRDLTVRYKRSFLGVWWTLLNPILTSLTLYLVFNTVFKSRFIGDGIIFAPYLLSGVLIAATFSQGVLLSAEAIAGGAGILTKVAAQPQVFAVAAAFAATVNFAIGWIPLVFVTWISGEHFSIFMPLAIIISLSLAFFIAGLGMIIATLYIRFDDTRSIVLFLLTLITYLAPVFYPLSAVSSSTQTIINLNPLTSYLQCFRWVFSGSGNVTTADWIYVFGSAFLGFWLGMRLLQKNWNRLIAMM